MGSKTNFYNSGDVWYYIHIFLQKDSLHTRSQSIALLSKCFQNCPRADFMPKAEKSAKRSRDWIKFTKLIVVMLLTCMDVHGPLLLLLWFTYSTAALNLNKKHLMIYFLGYKRPQEWSMRHQIMVGARPNF